MIMVYFLSTLTLNCYVSVIYVVFTLYAQLLTEYSLSVRSFLSIEPFLRNQVLSKENL